MKSGKTLTLYMTPRSFLTELWRSLFNEPKVSLDSKTQYDLHKKGEHWAWEYSDGTRTYKRKEFLSKVYYLNLKLGRSFRKSKLKAKEHQWILLRLMENLYGVLALACGILIFVLSLLLLVTVSLVAMFLQVLSLGLLMFLPSSQQKERLYVKILHWSLY